MSFSVGASGVWKPITSASIGVGGVWKLIIAMYIGAAGAWKNFFSSGLVGTVSTANYTSSWFGVAVRGYFLATLQGSISPSRFLADGRGVSRLESRTDGNGGLLQIDGFASDPGAGYLNFITWGASTKLGSAATYSYLSGSGTASWQWSSSFSSVANDSLAIAIN